jgi:hypothetical protein
MNEIGAGAGASPFSATAGRAKIGFGLLVLGIFRPRRFARHIHCFAGNRPGIRGFAHFAVSRTGRIISIPRPAGVRGGGF